ncbi:MAG: B12-binding domain-containing radical SAM protein [Anaerolineales bacterium]|nr:B12-binding domain-containing radical SAM protein [Anaerolineales bacterium]MCB9128565.1 B12-binding domain-containing radical SAM protein [Ardenticatenales bacterium]MCB9172949.1 B12-binding domain-containing radical SAM protein [Ardenticatenales bacterium]
MDILLTHGYFLYDDPHELQVMKPYPPLGLLYIASHLRAEGFAVDVCDNTFSSFEAFRARVEQERPPVVGFYTNMMTRRNVVRLIPVCKAVGSTVIVGGPDPANYPERFLDHGADIVVIGEGELTLSELLPHLAAHGPRDMAHIAGIVYRDEEGRLVQSAPRPYIKDLNAQPFPARDAIDIHRYMSVWRQHHGQGAVSLITARGCPYKCTWCSHAVFGYTHRRRSVENVVDEVARIVADYDPELLWYADDVFTIHHRWLFAYAAELGRRNLHRPFETISREDRLNEAVVKTLADMGCYRIWVGAESGSQEILDAMQRRTDADRMVEMVKLLQKYGIQAGMFIMLGYEGEEEYHLQETVDRLKAASPDVFLTTVAYPIKNTAFYRTVEDRVALTTEWANGSDRDYLITGRRSPRYYRHATRWMVNEVALHKQRLDSDTDLPRMAKRWLNARLGRAGMWLARNDVVAADSL